MESDLLTLVEQDGFRAARRSTSRGGQYNGPCPFPDCGGTDRFRIQPNQGNYGWFACNQCGRKGSAVDYLMLKRGMSKQEALATVGWTPKDGRLLQVALPRSAYDERPQWNTPPTPWQEAATDFYQSCQRVLWSPRGMKALEYLRKRGLSDQVIKGALLGYHPASSYGIAKVWGKAVRLPRGIVIPWFFTGSLWRITIRDETVADGAQKRYTQVAGGSNGLYLADCLVKANLRRSMVVLVEGEFDALSVFQQCRDLVSVVATGTTQGSHSPRWIALLAQQERVFVAFDAEDKGDQAAHWWLARLEHARRLRPWWKDASQMLQDGVDLRTWIQSSVSTDVSSSRSHGNQLPAPPSPASAHTQANTESPTQEDTATTYHRLRTTRRVSTPAGPGAIFPYTPLLVQIQRGRIGVLLDHGIHPSGRLLEYFFPHEVQALSPGERENYISECER